jgi:cyclopropane-fatty-acyl-phospholipid synthase
VKLNSDIAHGLTEKGLIPDAVIRRGIRSLLAARLREIAVDDTQAMAELEQRFIAAMKHSPIALRPEKANEQHYEIPPEFYQTVLGSRLKYSCGYWEEGSTSLDRSEAKALQITCEHAQLSDGMHILELGCGWGSLSLWMAQHYPSSLITAVSNSISQGAFIRRRARELGLDNIEIITADMNVFEIDETFDRVVSIEMFEHMRNYRLLYSRVSKWLKPGGRFFKHIFVHRSCPYVFEDREANDWMSRYFFSGGMMPSDNLPLFFQDDLKIEQRWRWDGRHYEKTCNAWLEKMDANKDEIWPLFQTTYGEDFASLWWQRWRMFFMACAELFSCDDGQQWWVGHYLFSKR